MTILERALPLLRCPSCGENGAFKTQSNVKIECSKCGVSYTYNKGFIDFVPTYSGSKGAAQKTMESAFIVKVYEEFIRPRFTSLGTTLKYNDEESWLRKKASNVDANVAIDIACGTGRYARMMSSMFGAGIVLGIDISEPMLLKAIEDDKNEAISNILYIRANSSYLPINDESADWVNCFGALHLFEDPRKAIIEIGRVCKRSGLFTFLTAAKKEELLRTKYFQKYFSKLATFKFFSTNQLNEYLREANWGELEQQVNGMVLMGNSAKQ